MYLLINPCIRMVDVTQNAANNNGNTNGVASPVQGGVDPQQMVDSFQTVPADPQNSSAQGGAFGGVPFDQKSNTSTSVSTDSSEFDISADDIPDFSEPTKTPVVEPVQPATVTAPVVETPTVEQTNNTEVVEDISLDSLEQSVVPKKNVDPGFDPSIGLNANVTTQENNTSAEPIDLSGLGDMAAEPTSPAVEKIEDQKEKKESEKKEDIKPSKEKKEETVYDQGLAQEERDVQKDEAKVKGNRSKMVSKFYELTGLINQGLTMSKEKEFSVTGHATEKEKISYRFVPVKNVDAGFKIEKHVDGDQNNNQEIDVLTMTYKEAFFSLRLYMNGEMLYQEVKGDDKDDENRPVILDKINKFLLLVDEHIKKLSQAKKEEEKKKGLRDKLQKF